MRPSTVRRLVSTVPLAAVVAGAAGYALLPAETGVSIAPVPAEAAPGGAASMRSTMVAPVPEASAPVFAAVFAAGPAAPAPPGAAPVPVPGPGGAPAGGFLPAAGAPTWPGELPNGAAEQVDVAIRPLSGGWETRADGSYLDFQVTWTNTTGQRYDEVVPVVRVLPYDHPTAAARPGAPVKGTLDRKDLDEWREVKLNQPGVGSGPQQGAFALDPGESRTVRYRLTLVDGALAGRLPITAEGWVRRGARTVRAGGADVRVNVTVARPVRLAMTKPTDMVVGRVASELTLELTNLDASGDRAVAPALVVTDPVGPGLRHGLVPEDLIAEVLADGEWRRLPGTLDADGLVELDTTGLTRALAPGETIAYPFRFNLPKGWTAGNGLEIEVGGTFDGEALPARKFKPRMTWMPEDMPKVPF
ncbi:hypothetical protein [Kitasatospora sp. NPDC008115]|uniref:hypothetical protein n=1 Tax=Kitasatospora sp. NPDC008115 TaxID=3364022 RepID=UPI0036ECBC84